MKSYELKQIIKTTIREVLNEQKEINEVKFLKNLFGKNQDPPQEESKLRKAIEEIKNYDFHNLFIPHKGPIDGYNTGLVNSEISLKLSEVEKNLPTLCKIMPQLIEKKGALPITLENEKTKEIERGIMPMNFLYIVSPAQYITSGPMKGNRMMASKQDLQTKMQIWLKDYVSANPFSIED